MPSETATQEEVGQKQAIPSWLVRIQQNSWEAEILLSGLVLFSLLRAPDLLYNFRQYLAQDVSRFVDLWYFEVAGRTAIQFLTWGFLCHLVMRGIWVGFVGLNYAFPQGIRLNQLKFQERFARPIKEAWIVPAILRMERYCSMTFSMAWMFFLLMLGLSFFYLFSNWILFQLIGVLNIHRILGTILTDVLTISAGLYFLDFFFGGFLRRIPKISVVLAPIFWLIRILCLTFLYENIYLTFISNIHRWKVSVFFIFLGLIGWATFRSNIAEYRRFPGALEVLSHEYDNLRPPHLRTTKGSIQADVIKGDILKVFISHNVRFEPLMAEICGLDGKVSKLIASRDAEFHRCLSQYFKISIDGVPVKPSPWFFHTKHHSKDFGYLIWVDIAELKKGPHLLAVTLKKSPAYAPNNWLSIPFYRE